MNNRLTEGEMVMKITQLIGLGEQQRRIYEYLERSDATDEDLSNAYIHHQNELELLIKYQKSLNE